MKTTFFLLLLSVLANKITGQDEKGPVINTPQGDIKGTWKSTINGRKIQAFMGIPYAKPPVGPLRFKNPEPFGTWSSVRDGTADPPVCPQTGKGVGSPEPITGNEDCLYLNVYTPDASKESKYPVMLFLHGGGFLSGGCLSDIYGPDMLLDKDIVLVVINYRIGVLGFASTEDEEILGNFGLKDQILAMKWIQENIASYGGNPDSVTIFGVCAGGSSTHYHTLSQQSKGLFHRAIAMSGAADSPWAISAPGKVSRYVMKTGEKLNCSTSSTKELAACLSNIPAPLLVETGLKFIMWEGKDPIMPYTPVFEREGDESFITVKSFTSNSNVPMIIGATSDEAANKVAVFYNSPAGIDNVLESLDENFTDIAPVSLFFDDKAENPAEVSRQIKEFFFEGKKINKDSIPQVIKMYSDALYYEGVKSALKRHSGPSYIYMLAYNGEHSLAQKMSGGKFRQGVAHADDLLYLFPIKAYVERPNGLNAEDKKMSEQFINYFTNFATYGIPTPDKDPVQWTEATANNNYLLINGSSTKMLNNFLSERDSFWKNIEWQNKLIPQNK
ncbi:venom carboxylesterase-6-like [Lycorma delicatula]|uniref:venom carboxylesterase-6-like n=1 Tax=Lycorma delicatula TaxID=130591 RepID=UPI003F50F791